MRIKVIIRDGIAEAVLMDTEEPVEIEVVDYCKDYEDAEQLEAYMDELYADKSLHQRDFTVARFSEEE